jgi:O-antigen/teichoic acid export membrane protein
MSLGEKTVKGVLWNYVSFASGKFLTFISTIILARLLAPDLFGLVAIALLAIQYLDAIGDLGVSEALIYQRDNVERAANIAFIVSIIAGVVLATVAYFGAPLVASFYNEPDVTLMLQVLGASLIINSFGQTQLALMTKELRFRQKVLPDLGRSLIKGVASIAFAFMGFGAWSLIWGQVAGAVAMTAILWLVSKWRPRFMWDWALARTMINYGGQVVLIQMISVLWATADYLIIGRLLGRVDLALYQQAFRVTDLLIINIAFVVGKVLFPSYAKLNNDMARIREGFLVTVRYLSLATLPLSVGISVIAPLFVSAVFGPKWLAMTPALQLLALRAGISTLSFNSGHVLKAIGRTGIINYQMVIKLSVLVAVVFLTVPYGFVGVAAGQVGVTFFGMLLDYATMRWLIKVPLVAIWKELWPNLIATIVMGGLTWLSVNWLVTTNILQGWELVGMLGAMIVGVISYGTALWLVRRDLLLEGIGWVRRAIRSQQPAMAKP